MVNVFGDRGASSDGSQPGPRSPRGVKGDPGKSGIDNMCRWIPDLTEQFQKNETSCFQLTDPAKDLTKTAGGAYVTWLSRSGCHTKS